MGSLTPELVSAYRRLNTCAVSNAIDRLNVRLRNEGFADATVRCTFPDLPAVIGHAVTARIRCSTPPPTGRDYIDRTDWWNYVASVPAPRILAVQDIDERPGLGALVGEIHANVLKALGCVAYATNGSVRDVEAVHDCGFQCFAGAVAVSHAFVHLVDFGGPVTLGGLRLESEDIVYGDRHGILTVPRDVVNDIPATVDDMIEGERRVIDLCRSSRFSIESLRSLVRQLS